MRRNIDLFAVGVILLVAGIWSFVGQSGLARAIASGQLRVPNHFVHAMVNQPHSSLPLPSPLRCY